MCQFSLDKNAQRVHCWSAGIGGYMRMFEAIFIRIEGTGRIRFWPPNLTECNSQTNIIKRPWEIAIDVLLTSLDIYGISWRKTIIFFEILRRLLLTPLPSWWIRFISQVWHYVRLCFTSNKKKYLPSEL